MKLTELVQNISKVDENLIIFQENRDDYRSDVTLSYGGDANVITENGKEFYYLIEVFLAKEFIDDWLQTLGYSPNTEEIAKRLYDYAINDA